MALPTKRASQKSTVPTSSSLAASGPAGIFTAPRVARSAAGAVMTTDEVTAAAAVEATAVVGRWLTWTACIGAESSDHAKPTGTARAATIAASNNTRYRLRIPRISSNHDLDSAIVRSTVSLAQYGGYKRYVTTVSSAHAGHRKRGTSRKRQWSLHVFSTGSAISALIDAVSRNEFSQLGDWLGVRRPCVTLNRAPNDDARQAHQSARCPMAISPNNAYPQLLSLAVHEFRTPASVVGGYLRMLQRDGETALTERQRKMVDEAEKSCGRLVALITEMSDISKLDAGLISLARQPLDLFALVGEVAELVQEARDREVRLEVRGEAAGASVAGDAARLRSAFDAVLRAILREKPGPSTVIAERRIDARGGITSAVVVIADAASVQAAYDRAPGPFDEKRGGLGLALPLARRVIEGHGGRLWSPAPAEGAADGTGNSDALSRGSAIVSVPLVGSQ